MRFKRRQTRRRKNETTDSTLLKGSNWLASDSWSRQFLLATSTSNLQHEKHSLHYLKSPYSGIQSFELIDSAMVSAIFENNVSILFRAEGVWSLLSDQNGELLNSKTYSKVLSALPTYEIDNLYFCEDSINERQINRDQIDIPVKPLSLNEQQQLIANQDIVMAGQK